MTFASTPAGHRAGRRVVEVERGFMLADPALPAVHQAAVNSGELGDDDDAVALAFVAGENVVLRHHAVGAFNPIHQWWLGDNP